MLRGLREPGRAKKEGIDGRMIGQAFGVEEAEVGGKGELKVKDQRGR